MPVRITARLGAHHPQTLVSVWNLALLLFRHERYAEAAPLLRRAVTGFAANPNDAQCRKLLGPAQRGARECERKAKKAKKAPEEEALGSPLATVGAVSSRRQRTSHDLGGRDFFIQK